MATDLIMRKRLGSLWPADPASEDALRLIKQGEDIRVTITKPRNLQFHKLFFALVNLVYENTEGYQSAEHLLTVIKIGIGHCDYVRMPDGTEQPRERSIAFASMDDVVFRAFFNRAVDYIVAKIIPGTDKQALEREVWEMLGIPYSGAA